MGPFEPAAKSDSQTKDSQSSIENLLQIKDKNQPIFMTAENKSIQFKE